MPRGCAVPGCTTAYATHRFPKGEEKKRQWEVAIRRGDPNPGLIWKADAYDRVCDKHFKESDYHPVGSYTKRGRKRILRWLKDEAIPKPSYKRECIDNQDQKRGMPDVKKLNAFQKQEEEATDSASEGEGDAIADECNQRGKPSNLYQEGTVDWVPTLHLECDKGAAPFPDKGRLNRKRFVNVAKELQSLSSDEAISANTKPDQITELSFYQKPRNTTDVQTAIKRTFHLGDIAFESHCGKYITQSTQCDLNSATTQDMESALNRLTLENKRLKKDSAKTKSNLKRLTLENKRLKEDITKTKFSEDSFRYDDEKVKLYTGLPTFAVLMTLFNYINSDLSEPQNGSLTNFQKVILVLMRLRLNLSLKYLAHQFKVSQETIAKQFLDTLNIFFVKLQPLIKWPTKKEGDLTMPKDFEKAFGLKIASIIDCLEIFIEKPCNLEARSKTWSSYMHHNTVKYFIGITPQGTISFISNGYSGRETDNFVTNNCGFVDNLNNGDIVLADRHLTQVKQSLSQDTSGVSLFAFIKKECNLSVHLERIKNFEPVRNHVERLIGLVRNRYVVLQDTLPLDYFLTTDGSTFTIDKIVTVCCALTNMCKSVVPLN